MAKRTRQNTGSKNKKVGLQRHAELRAFDRYGVIFDRDGNERIRKLIHTNGAALIARQSLRVSIYDVPVENMSGKTVTARIVYDHQRAQVVTFLPPDAIVYDLTDIDIDAAAPDAEGVTPV